MTAGYLKRLMSWVAGPGRHPSLADRRQFLRHAVAAVPAIAISGELAELLKPSKTILLPSRHADDGWIVLSQTNIREDLVDFLYNVEPFRTPIFHFQNPKIHPVLARELL